VLGSVVGDDNSKGDSNDNDGGDGDSAYVALVDHQKDVQVRDKGRVEFPFDYHIASFAVDSYFFLLSLNVQYHIQYLGKTALDHEKWALIAAHLAN
jgi:hypothetical protein